MTKRSKILLNLFVIVFCFWATTIYAAPWPGPGQIKKGAVTHQELLSLCLDRMALWIRACEEYMGWNEAAGKWGGIKSGQTVNAPLGINTDGKWYMQLFLAADGTDEQIAMCGVPRDTLLARVQRAVDGGKVYSNIRNALQLVKNGTWNNYPATIATALSAAATRVPPWPAVEHDTVYLGFDDCMDYFCTARCVTGLAVPQDFADPRIIAGKPIKEWLRTWDRSRGQLARNPVPAPSYAPDFTGDHHGFVNVFYSNFGIWRDFYEGFTWNIMANPSAFNAADVSPYGHHTDIAYRDMKISSGDGVLGHPHGGEYGVHFNHTMAYAASVFKDPLAHAFLARGVYGMRALPSYGWNNRIRHSLLNMGDASIEQRLTEFYEAYLMLRFCGEPDTVISYSEASRRLHGTFRSRHHGYGSHRTPDKVVVHSWTSTTRTSYGIPASYNAPVHPYPWDRWRDTSRSAKALANGSYNGGRSSEGRVTLITPDNDSLRPDGTQGDLFFVKAFQGITGELYQSLNVETVSRWDNNDGVMATAARLNRLNSTNPIDEKAVTYHSLVSFYDKTTVAFARVLPGANGMASGSWKNGFAATFYVDPLLPYTRDLYYEGGQLDLKARMMPYIVFDSLNGNTVNATEANRYADTLRSSWWCFNGRLGLATIDGAGDFVVTCPPPAAGGGTSNYMDLWGMVVGRRVPLAASSVQMSTAAAYYTDTRPDQVQALQRTLVSLDSRLPDGWQGLISETPDSQRVLALVRFHGSVSESGLRLSYPEGAPIFERPTIIRNDTAIAVFSFDTLESFGQTMAYYVKGSATEAVQTGDLQVRLKGNGEAILTYLSRGNSNRVYINGVLHTKTRSELRSGIQLSLTDDWTEVRLENEIDDDHSGPFVEVVNPVYLSDEQIKFYWGRHTWEPEPVLVDTNGLDVQVKASDRSGVAYVDFYLDWTFVGRDSIAPYSVNLPYSSFTNTSIHAVHAVAVDNRGNRQQSVSVPFRVSSSNVTSVERTIKPSHPNMLMNVSKKVNSSGTSFAGVYSTKVASLSKTNKSITVDNQTFENMVKVDGKHETAGFRFDVMNNDNYSMIRLDMSDKKVQLCRVEGGKLMILAEVNQRIDMNRWYSLKVEVSGKKLTGYVDGIEKLAAARWSY